MEKLLSQAVKERRATPHFSSEPVSERDLSRILRAGLDSPSGYNLQPWRFIVIRNPEQKRRLRQAAMDQAKIEEAPLVIVGCGDTNGWRDGDVEETARLAAEQGLPTSDPDKIRSLLENLFCDGKSDTSGLDGNVTVWVNRQVMIALTAMMLTAETLGYDTAPMEGFWEKKVQAVLGLPEHVRVVALLAVGRGSGSDKPFTGRFDPRRTVFAEHWAEPLTFPSYSSFFA
jgi:nitroreductase